MATPQILRKQINNARHDALDAYKLDAKKKMKIIITEYKKQRRQDTTIYFSCVMSLSSISWQLDKISTPGRH